MSLQLYYEDSYKSESGQDLQSLRDKELHLSKGLFHYVQEMKNKFLTYKDWNGLRVLEVGSGRGGLSLHLARLGANVTLLDFSAAALDQAEKIFALEGFQVKTLLADASRPDTSLNEKFDLIVDSHLLHCICFNPERVSYYGFIQDHLREDGIFVAESMVHRKKLFIPDGFMFDQENILWQMFGEWKPVRRILDSVDLENEINQTGLKIKYFMYYANYAFVPHVTFMEIPSEVLPASVRFVLNR